MKKITAYSFSFIAVISLFGSLMIHPLFAQTDSTKSSTRQTQRMENLHTRADQEITRRTTALNELIARIGAMGKLSVSDKTALTSQIQKQITTLTTLAEKIKADTDLVTLQADVKSITGSYRIFALIIPKGHLLAAADRINMVSDTTVMVIGKLQARIDKLQIEGSDVAVLRSLLLEANAKVADAKVQAQAAIMKLSSLTPDNGDQAVFKANKEMLMSARADIKVGTQDLHIARKNIGTIVQEMRKPKTSSTIQPSTSPVPSVQ